MVVARCCAILSNHLPLYVRRNFHFRAGLRRCVPRGLDGGHGALLQGEKRLRDQFKVKHMYLQNAVHAGLRGCGGDVCTYIRLHVLIN